MRNNWKLQVVLLLALSVLGSCIAVAQPTDQLQSSPGSSAVPPTDDQKRLPNSKTPSPQPARPNPEAQKAGATPALPPAPAEKMGEPIMKPN